MRLLSTGLDFCRFQKNCKEKMITTMMSSITLSGLVAEEIHFESVNVLCTAKPSRSNITKDGKFALQSLKGNSDIVIRPADKRNATVVFSKDYDSKITTFHRVGSYTPLVQDSTSEIEREITSLVKYVTIPFPV